MDNIFKSFEDLNNIFKSDNQLIAESFEKALRESETSEEFHKSWSTDLKEKFPNGDWKTVNGAKVFINNGKVVAGLEGFNGEIDKFFKEKEAKRVNKLDAANKARSESSLNKHYKFDSGTKSFKDVIDNGDGKLKVSDVKSDNSGKFIVYNDGSYQKVPESVYEYAKERLNKKESKPSSLEKFDTNEYLKNNKDSIVNKLKENLKEDGYTFKDLNQQELKGDLLDTDAIPKNLEKEVREEIADILSKEIYEKSKVPELKEEKIVKFLEDRLEKVKKQWRTDKGNDYERETASKYVEFAEGELERAKKILENKKLEMGSKNDAGEKPIEDRTWEDIHSNFTVEYLSKKYKDFSIEELGKKLEELKDGIAVLSKTEYTDPSRENPRGGVWSDKYYKKLKEFQIFRDFYWSRNKPTKVEISKEEQEAIDLKNKREYDRAVRENMVTSTTHERWLKRQSREVDNRFKNRR